MPPARPPTWWPRSAGGWNPSPVRSTRAEQHLARAAQLERHQRRPPAVGPAGRPLLVDVARLVTHSRDPAQTAAIAAVVLLVYGLVRLLDHVAARHHAQVAVRRQLQLAADCMAEHALVTSHANDATTGRATAPSQRPMADVDHLRRAGQAEPARHQPRRIRLP